MSTPLAIPQMIIAKPITNSASTTQLPANTNRLYNLATDAFNIADGYFWAYAPVTNSGNPEARVGATTVAGEELEFIQKVNESLIQAPLEERPLEKTGKINPRSLCGVRIKVGNASLGINETHLLEASFGAKAGNTEPFIVNSEFTYQLTTRETGAMVDLYNGTKASSTGKVVSYTTPDLGLFSTTDQAARDLILANVAYTHNSQKNPGGNTTVALNLSQTNPGHTGAVTIANIIAAGVGTKVLIGFELTGEATYLKISEDILFTLQQIVAASTTVVADTSTVGAPVNVNFSALYVIPYLLSQTTTLPTTPANLHIAGTGAAAIRAQFMFFVCLDSVKPIYNEREDYKTGVHIGLTQGFKEFGASEIQLTKSVEARGSAERVRIAYRGHQYNQYNVQAGRRWERLHIEYPSELVKGGWYDEFLIEFCLNPTTNHGNVAQHRKIVRLFIPNYSLGGNTRINAFYNFDGTTTNAVRTALVTLLNDFDTVNRLGNPTLV